MPPSFGKATTRADCDILILLCLTSVVGKYARKRFEIVKMGKRTWPDEQTGEDAAGSQVDLNYLSFVCFSYSALPRCASTLCKIKLSLTRRDAVMARVSAPR